MLVYSLENIRVGLEEHQMMFHQRTEVPIFLLSLRLLVLEYFVYSHVMYRHVTQKSTSYIHHKTIGWLDSTFFITLEPTQQISLLLVPF